MTKSEQPKPLPLPLLLVYGKPTSPDLPQASWFRIEDRTAITAAAHTLKLTVIDIATDDDRALLDGVHEGVLKGNNRLIVGSVSAEVYQRLEEHTQARKTAHGATIGSDAEAKAKAVQEQKVNISERGSAVASTGIAGAAADAKSEAASSAPTPSNQPIAAVAPDPWDALRIGSHVVAKCWENDGEAVGWWIGKVTGFEKKDYVIVWLDDPNKTPPFKVERKHVAILHPSFDVKTEWDPKPRRRT